LIKKEIIVATNSWNMVVFMENNKQQTLELFKSGETGDNGPLSYINPDKFVQHNLMLKDVLKD
jgi:hypothetical protein